jgi:hypothetical protein
MPAKPTRPDSADPPHHHGYRARLRERFYSAGPDVLSGYELLETALPRHDTKALLSGSAPSSNVKQHRTGTLHRFRTSV